MKRVAAVAAALGALAAALVLAACDLDVPLTTRVDAPWPIDASGWPDAALDASGFPDAFSPDASQPLDAPP